MRRYYDSTRVARLIAKLALKTISDEERRELASLAKENGLNVDEILKKVTTEVAKSFEVADASTVAGNQTVAGSQTVEGNQVVADATEIEAGKRVWAVVERNISQRELRVGDSEVSFGRSRRAGFGFGRGLMRYAAIFAVVASLSVGGYWLRSGYVNSKETITLLANETVLEFPSGESVVLKEKTDIKSILGNQALVADKGEVEKAVAEIYKIKVSSGSTHTITLEDGTKIILYPESELQFPSFFGSTERSVTLVGEGYFDVQKDSGRPFSINTGGASVVVLGTSFNIRAYSNEPTIETVLVSGKVLMNSTELVPNQMAIFNRANSQISVENLQASIYSERANGMFIFDNRSLDEIMREFSLWFGFEYSYEDSALKDKKFRFKLPRTDSFNRLMNLMEKTGELRFDVSDKKVTILPGR
ncbi:MAG: hypothetical protein A2X17_08680 [Bacteroidetes bacterium GWF2_41_61]|nr:MAG: hypothetical protein A2X17_08680 [Bacteroidetes bacterium GWF2_41_61]